MQDRKLRVQPLALILSFLPAFLIFLSGPINLLLPNDIRSSTGLFNGMRSKHTVTRNGRYESYYLSIDNDAYSLCITYDDIGYRSIEELQEALSEIEQQEVEFQYVSGRLFGSRKLLQLKSSDVVLIPFDKSISSLQEDYRNQTRLCIIGFILPLLAILHSRKKQ